MICVLGGIFECFWNWNRELILLGDRAVRILDLGFGCLGGILICMWSVYYRFFQRIKQSWTQSNLRLRVNLIYHEAKSPSDSDVAFDFL